MRLRTTEQAVTALIMARSALYRNGTGRVDLTPALRVPVPSTDRRRSTPIEAPESWARTPRGRRWLALTPGSG